MSQEKPSLFIVSGEASGDVHGAHLVRALLILRPDLKIFGWGGDRMQAAGATILKHYRELAFMGFWEVIVNLWTIRKNFQLVKKQILERKPKVVVLIDYPGFNLRLLPWLKEHGFVVIYYIAPQAWAWKEGRVQSMRKYIDELLVILPFEEDFFKLRGLSVEFVGHPLLQSVPSVLSENQSKSKIALLPGSRKQEVSYILPVMMSVIPLFPDYQFVIAGMNHIDENHYRQLIGDMPVEIVFEKSDEVIQSSCLALVSSGTATLQTALMNVPQIVCYKTGWLNYELGKRVIKVSYISLVNLIFNREVVKELIQDELNQNTLRKEMLEILCGNKAEKMKQDYSLLRGLLGEKNASQRVANIVLSKYSLNN